MQWVIFYLIVSFSVSYGDFDLRKIRIKLLEQNDGGECFQQYKKLDSFSLAKLIDSSSNLKPEGILQGSFVDLGVFDECLSIADESNDVYGKYCLASIKVDEIFTSNQDLEANHSLTMIKDMKKKFTEIARLNLLGNGIESFASIIAGYINLGICIPNKCTNEDIQKIVPLKLDEEQCYTRFTNDKLDTKAIIAISTIVFFSVIAVCSTIYDVFITIHGTKTKYQILVAFSLYTNGNKLFKSAKNPDQLGCLHGIKAISMMWVILGHTYANMFSAPIDNKFYLNDWLDDPKSMFILSSTVSVDTFFTVGGLLTAYVFMKTEKMEMKESFKKVPLLYLHRYIRLTPAFAIMVLAYGTGLIKYLSDGPNWAIMNEPVDECVENWWAALTYIQNYKQVNKMCVSQSWYLSVDFQLFIFTPFLLIPLRKWPHLVIKFMSALVVIGMIIPFCIGYFDELTGVGLGMGDPAFANHYYYFTHSRFSPYVIGLMFGYFVYKIKSGEHALSLHIGNLLLLWTILIAGLLICIFDGFKMVHMGDGNEWVDGLYLGLNRSAWSLLISLIILLCCTNNGGPINIFLSHPVFQILSKLSYSMYLVHYIIILVVVGSYRKAVHFTNYNTLSQFYSTFVVTLSISVLFSLIFESPMITIEKLIFRKSDKKVEIIEEPKEKV